MEFSNAIYAPSCNIEERLMIGENRVLQVSLAVRKLNYTAGDKEYRVKRQYYIERSEIGIEISISGFTDMAKGLF